MAGISEDDRRAIVEAVHAANDQYSAGEYELAEPVYRRALQLLEDGCPEMLQSLHNLARIYWSREDFGEALKLSLRLLIVCEEKLGENDPSTISLMDEIAKLYEKLGRTSESHDMYERARKRSELSLWADQVDDNDVDAELLSAPAGEASFWTADATHQDLQPAETRDSVTEPAQADKPIALKESLPSDEGAAIATPVPDSNALPSPKSEEVQNRAPISQTLSKRKLMPIALALAVGFLALAIGAIMQNSPNDLNPHDVYRSMAHRYRTADDEKLFDLVSMNECDLTAGPNTIRLPYSQYLGDWKDAVHVSFSQLLAHQYWLFKHPHELVDEDGVTVYAEDSAELQIADYMDQISRAAQITYLKHHHYPQQLEELEGVRKAFRNPFTGQPDKPLFQSISFVKKKADQVEVQRKNLYNIAVKGGRWPHEPMHSAGSINCCAVVIRAPKKTVNEFFIRGCDKEGKVLTGSQPGSTFTIVLEDGAVRPPPRARLPFSDKMIVRPKHVWLIARDTSPEMKFMLRFGAMLFFGWLSLMLGVLVIFTRTRKSINKIIVVALVISSIFALLYMICGLLP